jgi:GH35 family endo-1,4-beta-xylanase
MSIERLKGVTPVGVTGEKVVEWLVKLSQEPTKGWRDAFKGAEVRAEFADPNNVTFRRNTLLFTCREEQLDTWVECLDSWIVHANRTEIQTREASARRTAEHEEEARGRERHLAELKDKYKNV